jgi:tRNA-Thr(GGU) m(6)t(6)A37 methyltransferase TsaA
VPRPFESVQPLSVVPIGVVRSAFKDKKSAPRQATVDDGAPGTIELYEDSRFEYALQDLERWSHIWVIFWFHLNTTWKPKVRPPRSADRRGVFGTRAPHRPNPIGLSAVALTKIDGLVLHVRGLDILDGSPVLDIKPYVPYADILRDAASGWLGERPDLGEDVGPQYAVHWTNGALERVVWLAERHGVELRQDVERTLTLGATPHPYRRIKRDGDFLKLALRDWRLRFKIEDRVVTVVDVETGYRARELNDERSVARAETPLDVHRAFVAKFG